MTKAGFRRARRGWRVWGPGWAARVASLAAAAATAAVVLSAGAAAAGADLVVVKEESRITFESCAQDAPLATGVIAIRNVGDSRALLRLGVLTRFTRSLLAVYAPEHLDMIDNAKERSALDTGDQELIEIRVGEGVEKKGRFARAETSMVMLDVGSLTLDEKKELQTALQRLGYYDGAIDGVLGAGFRAGVSRHQAALDEERTGLLTVSQTVALARRSGQALSLGVTSTSEAAVTIPVVLYAVVDPYNLVEESNEANNLEVFSGVIRCD